MYTSGTPTPIGQDIIRIFFSAFSFTRPNLVEIKVKCGWSIYLVISLAPEKNK